MDVIVDVVVAVGGVTKVDRGDIENGRCRGYCLGHEQGCSEADRQGDCQELNPAEGHCMSLFSRIQMRRLGVARSAVPQFDPRQMVA